MAQTIVRLEKNMSNLSLKNKALQDNRKIGKQKRALSRPSYVSVFTPYFTLLTMASKAEG